MKALSVISFSMALFIAGLAGAHAGVSIGGTRVIFDGAKKEASLSVNNPDTIAYLIQSWIETPSGGAEKAPFIITPPLYRLDKGQQNVMRIVRAENVPEDKESLFWLNIKSIPSAERKENTLQVAVKTRIKLIYRPAALNKSVPEDLANKLTWRKSGAFIQVSNPTPYYFNFNAITVMGKNVNNVTWVGPGATASFALPAGVSGGAVTFKLINDFGGIGEVHNSAI